MAKTILYPDKIKQTAEALSQRVHERFPSSGLYQLSQDLYELAGQAERAAERIARPIYWVRIAGGILIAAILAIVVSLVWVAIVQGERISEAGIVDLLGALEAGTNELILFGLAIYFLINLEARIERSRVAPQIHALRAIAHVIDMHQLTKDPASHSESSVTTKSSPTRHLTLQELIRYLDYCSELLSLTSKIAALYVQRLSDEVVMNSVSDVEQLCAGLARKIWQKLSIAEVMGEQRLRN